MKIRNLSEEKNPPRAQIFRYFRYESRNKNYCVDQLEGKVAVYVTR